uniref:Uncharacterized protein n=1 Tax=Tanacetum cinerariifolium TaxID=118510 RepID=A0A699GW76_TANCI|nr:hypothetical protein [Tanacetum cinerariifolium]
MDVLEYYAKHNMIAYLEKIEENAQFHEIVDFLSRSLIFYALTGRKSDKPRPKLDDSARLDADGVEYMETEEAVDKGRTSNKTKELNLDADTKVIAKDKGSGEKGESIISTARPKRISTARPKRISIADVTISSVNPEVSAVEPKTPPTTASIFDDEDITMAQTLIKMKEEKAKEKGVAFKEVKESDRLARSVLTLKTLLTIDFKDKGKAILEELEPKKMTRSDFDAAQVAREEEITRQLEAELHEEMERERQREEQESIDYITNLYDEVQARVDTDHELAVRLTLEEQEKYTINEKAADVHKEKVLEEHDSTKVLKMKARKKVGKQTHADDESSDKGVDNLKKRKAAFDEEEVVDYEVLEKRFPIINWELQFYYFDIHGVECIYYMIFRSDGSYRWIKTFAEMMTRFDRLDLVELYNLVMQRFETTTPEEDGTEIHMLAEKRYPFTIKTLKRMLSLRLIDESASDAAYDLLRFIQKQIDESGGYDRGEKYL